MRQPTRHHLAIFCSLLAISCASSHAADAQDLPRTYITGAAVFDGTGTSSHVETVVIAGDRIVAVGKDISIPEGATVIDGHGKTLTPGLFDLHTHWTREGVPATVPQIATAYVQAGVTTVNDFNEAPEAYAPLRSWLATLAAPHVHFAARISTPGGHGADWADQATTQWVTTAEDGRRAVANVLPYHPDLIKAFTDGWRYGLLPDNTSMNEDALAGITSAAHEARLKVLTHTVTVDRGLIAAQAHVDSLAHVLQDRPLTPVEATLIHDSGMGEIPTLAVYDPNKNKDMPWDKNPAQRDVRLQRFAIALKNVKRLYDRGVPVGVGTDAGMPGTPHGTATLHELELLVRAGLKPAQALTAATDTSARLAGLDADRGTIAVGKRADIDLFEGDPSRHIEDIHRLALVLIDGKPVWGTDAPPLPATNNATAQSAIPAGTALIDDFERPDGRSSRDTLVTKAPERGPSRSTELAVIMPKEHGKGHVMTITAQMSNQKAPYAGVVIPLSRGAIQPVDASAFHGIRLSLRGSSCTGSVALDRSVQKPLTSQVTVQEEWKTLRIPFSAFHTPATTERPADWKADDLVAVEVGASCPAGQMLWMQVDDVSFY